MKLRSALNNGFLFLSLGAIFVGLVKVQQFEIFKFAPFLLFFVFFRIKMWLDDTVYFHNTKRKTIFFDLGLVSAIIAWSLWAIAGYTIGDTQQSYTFTMWAIVVLSIWIVLDAIDQGSFGEGRPFFFIINLVYVAVLWFLTCKECSVPFDKGLLAYILVAGTVLDFLFNGSLKHFKEEGAPSDG
jgi:hypothetical protein